MRSWAGLAAFGSTSALPVEEPPLPPGVQRVSNPAPAVADTARPMLRKPRRESVELDIGPPMNLATPRERGAQWMLRCGIEPARVNLRTTRAEGNPYCDKFCTLESLAVTGRPARGSRQGAVSGGRSDGS